MGTYYNYAILSDKELLIYWRDYDDVLHEKRLTGIDAENFINLLNEHDASQQSWLKLMSQS